MDNEEYDEYNGWLCTENSANVKLWEKNGYMIEFSIVDEDHDLYGVYCYNLFDDYIKTTYENTNLSRFEALNLMYKMLEE